MIDGSGIMSKNVKIIKSKNILIYIATLNQWKAESHTRVAMYTNVFLTSLLCHFNFISKRERGKGQILL